MKNFVYKIFSNDGYVGNLPDVSSEFGYTQNINSTGAQLIIQINKSLDDVGATQLITFLVDEAGNNIVDEGGNFIVTEKRFTFSTIPINLANRIKVYMHDEDYTDLLVFDGLISSVESNEEANSITITVLSWGIELSNTILRNLAESLDQSQELAYDGFYELGPQSDTFNILAQSIQFVAPAAVSSVSVYMQYNGFGDTYCKLTLIEGTPASPGSILGTTSRDVSNLSEDFVTFTFVNPINVVASTNYHFTLEPSSANSLPTVANGGTEPFLVFTNGTNPYASGTFWTYDPVTSETSDDMLFKIFTTSDTVNPAFNSVDPSNILTTTLDYFNNTGGVVTYSDDSIDATNTLVSYTFRLNTMAEGLQKVLELSPGGWYYYVDVGSNLVHLHSQGDSPDHTFTFGKQIDNLVLKYTLENLKNVVYFTGGENPDSPGENLFRLNVNNYSVGQYGAWLERKSDNRVTDPDTADQLSTALLSDNSVPVFQTELTISSGVYDIETITLGQMIAFANSNDFVNSLLLQVVGLSRRGEKVNLKLDTLAPPVSKRIEDIKRNLDAQETLNNPESPN